MVDATPTHETRARRKRPKEVGQTSTALNYENSPPNLKDSCVDVTGALAYMHTFTMVRVPLPSTDRVKHGGKAMRAR